MGLFSDLISGAAGALGIEEPVGAFVGRNAVPFMREFAAGAMDGWVGINVEPTPEDLASFEAVTASAIPGGEPSFVFPDGFRVSGPVVRLLTAGTGVPIRPCIGIRMHRHALRMDDLEQSSSWDEGAPDEISLADLEPSLARVLTNERVGVRILVAAPLREGSVAVTYLFVFDVVGVVEPEVRKALPEHSALPDKPAALKGASLVESLRSLADLHTAGLLTETEFVEAKAQLLGSG